MRFTFIILHYKALKETMRCINSINENYNASIIVLDNGSNDGSGEKLKDYYKTKINIEVLISGTNNGYSKGNNIAYDYMLKKKLDGDFIIVCNNDIIFTQNNFFDKLKEVYKETEAAVIGPDIQVYSNNDIHQNPLMMRARNIKQIKSYMEDIQRKKRLIPYLVLKENVKKLLGDIHLKYRKRKQDNTNNIFDYKKYYKDIVLSGACLIFTPNYFRFYDKLFFPETFFYHEEEILYYKLKKNNLYMYYTPQLWVEHDHSISTSKGFKHLSHKLKFQYENNIESCKVLIKLIEENESKQ